MVNAHIGAPSLSAITRRLTFGRSAPSHMTTAIRPGGPTNLICDHYTTVLPELACLKFNLSSFIS
ncbi:unnamed protein product [Penicillium roqueforti FM164]|uniref:Uncharacterized protein n=1 Tax=Penicillium roqueforti (strain FM164) TaxID=1365484 RepID=W6QI23_PENRF|nr:unnamed protein product [Penicillium roqueforti FM164]